jgi:5'-nucleotidase
VRILLTNDDGIAAEGLAALSRVAGQFGEVFIVAPDRERSACAHAMTLREPLRIRAVPYDGAHAFETNGLPVDCVNLGLEGVCEGRCDLVLSGINAGPNLGFDVTYSGTVAGAMEGVINGIPSISISMASFVSGAPMHFATGAEWLTENFSALVELQLPANTFLNINVPNVEFVELRGNRVASMGHRVYEERLERRSDPWGTPYYWQGGVQVLTGFQPHTDVAAVSEGFVSVTPITLDWTAREVMANLRSVLEHLP